MIKQGMYVLSYLYGLSEKQVQCAVVAVKDKGTIVVDITHTGCGWIDPDYGPGTYFYLDAGYYMITDGGTH